ncbi:MAG: hypothetical protein LBB41_04355, partial [Prevotellaceae bacterium]|nr:hypothetical protein [Prevotellaceae bacterium]
MDIIERFFDKWWKLLIYSAISATIAVLSSTFYNEWLLLLGLILGFIFLFTSIFYKKHWRLTLLTVLLN